MKSVICTLYEGHYHHGVAALSNSLYKKGFRGSVYVGYRGGLPPWAIHAYDNQYLNWQGTKTLAVADGLDLHFLPVVTNFHLANFKPDFMLQLWETIPNEVEAMFYFDPDITLKCHWDFIEKWSQFGVTLVHEIVGNDMPHTHPKRGMWNEIIIKSDKEVKRQINNYFNSGFCGVTKANIEFLKTWSTIIHISSEYFGFKINHFSDYVEPWSLFPSGDQDAMNIATMCSNSDISEFGPEGMDFTYGGWLMSHSTCQPKPWKINLFNKFINGRSISMAEKNYWENVNGVINSYSKNKVDRINFFITVLSFLQRFYKK